MKPFQEGTQKKSGMWPGSIKYASPIGTPLNGTPIGLVISPRDLSNVFVPTVDKKKRLRKNIKMMGQRESFGFEYGPVHILASNENGHIMHRSDAR